MKKSFKQIVSMLSITAMMVTGLAGCGAQGNADKKAAEKAEFVPSLDTEKEVTLEIVGFLGNFEALDQVINDFNEYYPNVTINYEQNEKSALADYLQNNEYVDIFMTSDDNVRDSEDEGAYVIDDCLDLSQENLDTDAIDPEMLAACTVDGKLVRIPLAKMMCGLVVNKTLLENEGLEVPETYEEFLSVCETLKEKGYTPIQSARNHVCSDLILPMAMSIIENDEKLVEKANSGDSSYADSLYPAYEHLAELIDKGYISDEVNSTYPEDNYDGSILAFFEGDVPFWVANAENVSGMKKRESRSEAYSANPFEYEFINVPLGDNGTYGYEEPWYGFSVNKNGSQIDYAVEFMGFLMMEEELNKLAEVKGMPSVTINNTDARFAHALHPERMEARYVDNGKLNNADITGAIADAGNQMGYGEINSVEAAIAAVKDRMD